MRTMSRPTQTLVCAVLCLFGCAADPGATSGANPGPIAARDPQVRWRCWVFDVPAGSEVAPDGSVRPAVGRGSGFAAVPADGIPGLLAALGKDPAVRLVVAKVFETAPGEQAIVTVDRDPSRVVQRWLAVRGHRHADGIVGDVELTDRRGDGMVGGGSGQQLMRRDQAYVWLWYGATPEVPATWCMLLPEGASGS